jgi:hypothetical protein
MKSSVVAGPVPRHHDISNRVILDCHNVSRFHQFGDNVIPEFITDAGNAWNDGRFCSEPGSAAGSDFGFRPFSRVALIPSPGVASSVSLDSSLTGKALASNPLLILLDFVQSGSLADLANSVISSFVRTSDSFFPWTWILWYFYTC